MSKERLKIKCVHRRLNGTTILSAIDYPAVGLAQDSFHTPGIVTAWWCLLESIGQLEDGPGDEELGSATIECVGALPLPTNLGRFIIDMDVPTRI